MVQGSVQSKLSSSRILPGDLEKEHNDGFQKCGQSSSEVWSKLLESVGCTRLLSNLCMSTNPTRIGILTHLIEPTQHNWELASVEMGAWDAICISYMGITTQHPTPTFSGAAELS